MGQALAASANEEDLADRLFTALARSEPAPDAQLPDTGVGLLRERLLSPRFVRIPDPDAPGLARYGTRCSTVLVRHADGRVFVAERSVTADGSWLPAVVHRLPPQR